MMLELSSGGRINLHCETLEVISKETFVDHTAERALRFLVDQTFSTRSLGRNSVYQVNSLKTMMEFVAEGLGVSLVPSALARWSPHSKQLHALLTRRQDQELPKWRIGIATRAERRTAFGKTTVDLFLDTLATVVRFHGVDAAVAYHGGDTDKYLGELDGLHAPLLMHLAEEDEFISKAAQTEIKAALAKKPNATVHIYPGQNHAFSRYNGAHYNAAAAHLANGRTSDFLNRRLR